MRNANHPRLGSTIKVDPIRDVDDIYTIKTLLAAHPRDLCIFTFGINAGYRAKELLSIRCGQVASLRAGDELQVWQSKTKKYRIVTLNHSSVNAIQQWLAVHPNPSPTAPLFKSRNGGALTVSTLSNMVKAWCRQANLYGNFGSHTLRKTWGYHLHRLSNARLTLLMEAYGHSTEGETLAYLGIQSKEVSALNMMMEL